MYTHSHTFQLSRPQQFGWRSVQKVPALICFHMVVCSGASVSAMPDFVANVLRGKNSCCTSVAGTYYFAISRSAKASGLTIKRKVWINWGDLINILMGGWLRFESQSWGNVRTTRARNDYLMWLNENTIPYRYFRCFWIWGAVRTKINCIRAVRKTRQLPASGINYAWSTYFKWGSF